MKTYKTVITELSKQTLGSYAKKASNDSSDKGYDAGHHMGRSFETDDQDQWSRGSSVFGKSMKRRAGVHRAINKLTKEDLDQMDESEFAEVCENFEQLDELSKETLKSYINKAGTGDGQGSEITQKRAKGIFLAAKKLERKRFQKYSSTGKSVGEGIEYPVNNARSPADQEFVGAHPVQTTDDANGNGDEVFKGTTSKDKSRIADKWTGDDDSDDAESETGLDTAGTYHNKVNEGAGVHGSTKSFRPTGKLHHDKSTGKFHPIHYNESYGVSQRTHKGFDSETEAHKFAKEHAYKPVKLHDDGINGLEEEQLQEISHKVLGSYLKKAGTSAALSGMKSADAGKSIGDRVKSFHKADRRAKGISRAGEKLVKEDEDLQELSKATLGSYIKKSLRDYGNHRSFMGGHPNSKEWSDAAVTVRKRRKGIEKATDKLTKEDFEIFEGLEEFINEQMMSIDPPETEEQLYEISATLATRYSNKVVKKHGNDITKMDDKHVTGLHRAAHRIARSKSAPALRSKINKLGNQSSSDHKHPFEYDASRTELSKRGEHHFAGHVNRGGLLKREVDREPASKMFKEDMGESNGTSVSNETDSGTPKVHVTTGDKKHTVHRQRSMSSSHYVVHDHQSGTKKTFPYAGDVADHLNDSGHSNVHTKHFQALY